MAETARLEALLDKLTVRLQRSVVHDFRVSVKKLKAVISASATTEEYNRTLPVLMELYQALGRSRDLQVIGSLLSTLPAWASSPEARLLWKQKLAARQKKLLQWLADPKHIQLLRAEIHTLQGMHLHLLHPRHMASPHPPQEAVWHDTRKEVKNQLYRNEASHVTGTAFQQEQKNLNTIQHLIGHWHDWQIACQWIRKHRHRLPASAYWPLVQQADMQRHKAAMQYRQLH